MEEALLGLTSPEPRTARASSELTPPLRDSRISRPLSVNQRSRSMRTRRRGHATCGTRVIRTTRRCHCPRCRQVRRRPGDRSPGCSRPRTRLAHRISGERGGPARTARSLTAHGSLGSRTQAIDLLLHLAHALLLGGKRRRLARAPILHQPHDIANLQSDEDGNGMRTKTTYPAGDLKKSNT